MSNTKTFINFFKKHTILVFSIISVGFVLLCWLLTYFLLKNYNAECRGTFGDMFGGVNALFSGLAFCGIIISILLQSSELRLQRDEIKANREELVRTTEVQTEQGISLNRQAENLKISAKLSALNTLVNYYTEKGKAEKAHFDELHYQKNSEIYFNKAQQYLAEIEEILRRKNQ